MDSPSPRWNNELPDGKPRVILDEDAYEVDVDEPIASSSSSVDEEEFQDAPATEEQETRELEAFEPSETEDLRNIEEKKVNESSGLGTSTEMQSAGH